MTTLLLKLYLHLLNHKTFAESFWMLFSSLHFLLLFSLVLMDHLMNSSDTKYTSKMPKDLNKSPERGRERERERERERGDESGFFVCFNWCFIFSLGWRKEKDEETRKWMFCLAKVFPFFKERGCSSIWPSLNRGPKGWGTLRGPQARRGWNNGKNKISLEQIEHSPVLS